VGIAERKERQKAELRDQILAAARTIVAADGFDGLTMRKIAESIEYSAGTIYLYFASREEIAIALCHEGFGKLLAALQPAAHVADLVERLRAIGTHYIQFGLDDPQTYRLIFMEDAKYVWAAFNAPDGEHQPDDPGTRAFGFLADTVREAIALGRLKVGDPETIANVLWSCVHGIVSNHITCDQMLPDVHGTWTCAADALLYGLTV
jgi:AcrR family transcriptional regulator